MSKIQGKVYLETGKSCLMIKNKFYTVKKIKSGFAVYELYSEELYNIFPSHIRAYYAASRLNGMVKDFFKYEF